MPRPKDVMIFFDDETGEPHVRLKYEFTQNDFPQFTMATVNGEPVDYLREQDKPGDDDA